jgi:hypothetical protein
VLVLGRPGPTFLGRGAGRCASSVSHFVPRKADSLIAGRNVGAAAGCEDVFDGDVAGSWSRPDTPRLLSTGGHEFSSFAVIEGYAELMALSAFGVDGDPGTSSSSRRFLRVAGVGTGSS